MIDNSVEAQTDVTPTSKNFRSFARSFSDTLRIAPNGKQKQSGKSEGSSSSSSQNRFLDAKSPPKRQSTPRDGFKFQVAPPLQWNKESEEPEDDTRKKKKKDAAEMPPFEDPEKHSNLFIYNQVGQCWVKFWFVLRSGFLYQYKEQSSHEPLAQYHLNMGEVSETPSDEGQCIQLRLQHQTLLLKTLQGVDADETAFNHFSWIISLNGALAIHSTAAASLQPTLIKAPKQKQRAKSAFLQSDSEEPKEKEMSQEKDRCLSKKGFLKVFKSRWFWVKQYVELTDGSLNILNSEGGKAVASLNIAFCTSRISRVSKSNKFCFEVVHTKKTYLFLAESGAEMLEWVTIIQNSQAVLMREILSYNIEGKAKVEEMDSGRTKLRELVRLPGNSICADCSTKDPLWASVNLGIFICLQCSGAHRELGVHISQVRSVTMDKWKPEFISTIEDIGNIKSNLYFEDSIIGGYKKLKQEDSLETRRAYIRAKYSQRLFARTDGVSLADTLSERFSFTDT